MPTLIEEVKLIYSDVVANNNKFWYGELYDNGDVITRWGRVGYDGDSKTFPGRGRSFLETKKREKERKGYSELKVVNGTSKTTTVQNTHLHEVVKKDLGVSDPLVEKLIARLVRENVHKITSNTNITFDAAAGTFSTPLGIVTLDAINEARTLLTRINQAVMLEDYTNRLFTENVSTYLRLVPQNLGMRIDVKNLFPNASAVSKQSDLLDSLEASYNACTKAPVVTTGDRVFRVKLTPVDARTLDRLRKKYKTTLNTMHSAARLDMKLAYVVEIETMADAFQSGKKCGNVMELWHGTRSANVLSILKSGLKVSPPSTAAVTGKMFGNGIYFSDQSTKSLNYSYGYWGGGTRDENCFMFVADVAMGNAYVPSSSLGSYWKLPKGYDSCFAKAGRSAVHNNEMIVYNENQCNLTFLCEFGR